MKIFILKKIYNLKSQLLQNRFNISKYLHYVIEPRLSSLYYTSKFHVTNLADRPGVTTSPSKTFSQPAHKNNSSSDRHPVPNLHSQMSSLNLARLASRTLRSRRGPRHGPSLGALKGAPAGFTYTSCFSSSARMESGKGAMGHEDETFEEFTARYGRFRTGEGDETCRTQTIRRLFQGKSWRKVALGAQLTNQSIMVFSDSKRSLIWCKMSSNYRCDSSAPPPPSPIEGES